MNVKSSQNVQQMELGEVMLVRKEEVKAGAATVWKQKRKRTLESLEMSMDINSSLVIFVVKLSEWGKKT